MKLIDVLVPQMGEGLHEVRIVELQKKPGDTVRRDDLLYSMETDKAIMEVESPYAGVLREWLAQEGDILTIGAPIARIDAEPDAEVAAAPLSAPPAESEAVNSASTVPLGSALPPVLRDTSGVQIPPRTRAYAREKGLSDEELRQVSAATGKLMPDDIDLFLKQREAQSVPQEDLGYVERPLSQQHRVFIYRLKRSAQVVVPGVIKRTISWSGIRAHATRLREIGGVVQPSSFQTFAYCVVQAVKDHPKFRSALIGDATVREYAHVNIGIAVGGDEGRLSTAVVPGADTLDFGCFVQTAQANIQRARDGEDQADENTQIHLSYLGPYDVVDAIPVLVAPAVAVLFIGSTFEQTGDQVVNIVLTFDHRLIQGIEAAQFMVSVAEKVQQLEQFATL